MPPIPHVLPAPPRTDSENQQHEDSSDDKHSEHDRDKNRQEIEDEKGYARSTREVEKLLEGERPENLIFYLNELGDGKAHR